jgi:poly(3-hydroxybutyrate) depolymerase
MPGKERHQLVRVRLRLSFFLHFALLGAGPLLGQPILYERTYVSPADGVVRVYEARMPAGYDGVSKIPAALFLHGRGGDRRSFQTEGYFAGADAHGFALVFWEGRFDYTIGAYSTQYVDGVNGIPDETDVLACLTDALASFPIDPDRVHLVGFSQGGKGALLIGLKNPDRFASIVDGSGPSDAFEGQLWSPGFPDFRAAAGGDPVGTAGPVLARWFAQSARFFLGNARNVPLYLAHGTADTVVPDSVSLFPYRNTHDIADTPGFKDARGSVTTLSELRLQDSGGYVYRTSYPAGVDHVEELVLAPGPIFDFMLAGIRAHRPDRVVATTYDATERSYYWTRLGRINTPDGKPAGLDAIVDRAANAFTMTIFGNPSVEVHVRDAGLDPLQPLRLHVVGGLALLRLSGPFPARLQVFRDGILQSEDAFYSRIGSDVLLSPADGFHGEEVRVEAGPQGALSESDLLVPALVEAQGLSGAVFSTELTLTNLSPRDLTVEALLLDGSAATTSIRMSAFETLSLASHALFTSFGKPGGVAPLRLRIVAGTPGVLLASSRVFNTVPGGGTYGLSFPVLSARESVLNPGEEADLFGTADAHPARMNVSLFAPFEDVTALVETFGPTGGSVSSITLIVPAGSRIQQNDVLSGVPNPGQVVVSILSGRAQVYGTVISNASTNDPFRSPPLPRSQDSTVWTIPAVAAASGRDGVVFSSDVFLGAPPGVPNSVVSVDLTYRSRDGSPPVTVTTPILQGTTRVLADVLRSTFPASVPGAGALEIRSPVGLQVLAVTRSDSEAGPAAQDVASIRGGDEITNVSPAAFVGVAEFEEARSNLVLVNEGLGTTVDLWMVYEGGVLGSRVPVDLGAGETRQLDSFARLFAPSSQIPVKSGALLVIPAPGGKVVASVARIDNRTNDPTGIAPVPIPSAATLP